MVYISPFYNLQDQMKIMTATQECIDQDITSDGFIESLLQHQKKHVICPIKPKRNPVG